MNNIKKARERAGLSQKQVAINLKVSAPTVSEWESGKQNISAKNLMELSQLLGVSADYLLGVSNVPNRLKIDDEGTHIMIHSDNPISILFSLYKMTAQQFSEISGIPLQLVEQLSVLLEPIDHSSSSANNHPLYAELKSKISEEQWKAISTFFEVPVSNLKSGELPLYPKDSVRLRIDELTSLRYAAFDKDGDYTPEEIAKIKDYIDLIRKSR